jgi:hypothetical protein
MTPLNLFKKSVSKFSFLDEPEVVFTHFHKQISNSVKLILITECAWN